jgi:hypothetical protein
MVFPGSVVVPDPRQIKNLDPHQFTDFKSKYMDYEPILALF